MGRELWGRDAVVEQILTAVQDRGGSVVVDLTTPDAGAATAVLDAVADGLGTPPGRVRPSAVDRSTPGAAAEHLDAQGDSQVIVVEDAHNIDGTSLAWLAGRLDTGAAIIISHADIDGVVKLNLDRLATAADTSVATSIEPLTAAVIAGHLDVDPDMARLIWDAARHSEAGLAAVLDELGSWDGGVSGLEERLSDLAGRAAGATAGLDPVAARVVESIVVADRPISVAALAALSGATTSDILDLGEQLVARGLATESPQGFGPPAEPTRSEIAAGIGAARRAFVLTELAGALEATGEAIRNPGVVGMDLFAAESWDRALAHLQTAARDLTGRGAGGEAFPLVDAALQCIEAGAQASPADHGELLFTRGAYYRNHGYTDLAIADLERAVSLMEGVRRVDALGFLAATHDDRQAPQTAATLAAMAQAEASRVGEPGKLGSLLTLQGRELARIGLAAEADRVIDTGSALIATHGERLQQFNAKTNRAWIAFDRGRVGEAEQLFAELVDEAQQHNPELVADRLVWLARAQFAGGDPAAARQSLQRASAAATAGDDLVIRFLSAVAIAEGALLYGQAGVAGEAVEREAGLVSLLLPAWENGTHYRRGTVAAATGDWETAAAEVEAALAATPAGADGQRWRMRIEALGAVVAARTGNWDRVAAENLTDDLLVANWYGAAVDLMIARSRIESDANVGIDAAALAMRLGNPMKAAEAIEAAGAWSRAESGAVAGAVQRLAPQVPDEWREDWQRLPHVASALALPAPEVETQLLDERLDEALAAAGLANPDAVYSPAQRAARGLGRRAVRRRGLTAPRILGIAAGLIVVAGLAGFIGSQFNGGDPPATTAAATTVATTVPPTAPPTTEPATIPIPEGGLVGQAPYLGGPALTGVFESGGFTGDPKPYWTFDTGGPTRSSPTVLGKTVLVGGGNGQVLIIGTDRSNPLLVSLADRIDAPIAIGELALGESVTGSGGESVLVAADSTGLVVALGTSSLEIWSIEVGSAITAAPVITDHGVVVLTADGRVISITPDGSAFGWEFPGEGQEPLGRLEFTPVFSDGLIFVPTEEAVYVLDSESGVSTCAPPSGGRPSAPATLADGYLYVPVGPSITVLDVSTCSMRTDGLPTVLYNVAVVTSPVVVDDTIFVGSGQLLTAISATTGDEVFQSAILDGQVTGSPVLADGVLYVGTAAGTLFAVDASSLEILWSYDTGGTIDAPVAVIDDAVFVLTAAGELIALGPR